jgi:RHS repeat-associated protein
VQDSFGGVTTYIYDAANRLTSEEFGGSSQTPLRIDQTFTARNQLATQTRCSDLAGTQTIGSSAYTYDNAGRLTNLQHSNASNTILANYTYTYDLANRLTAEQLNGTTTSYSYDAVNELTNDTANSYSFDLNGNRNYGSYQTGTGNELSKDGTWTYTYDNEGNLTKKTKGASAETWTYGYDNQNHLTSIQQRSTDGGTLLMQATYTYDAMGDRLEKDVWTQATGTVVTRFAYDQQNAFADLNSSNQLQMRRLYFNGVDQLFARINSSGTAAWYLTDRLGSVRDIADNTGAVQDHINYDGFGNATETNSSFGDRYKWTGRELDNESGLQYNRARYYDPKIGRWLSQDPIGFAGGDSNLYRYVGDNTENGIDPVGLDFISSLTRVRHLGFRAYGYTDARLKRLARYRREIQLAADVYRITVQAFDVSALATVCTYYYDVWIGDVGRYEFPRTARNIQRTVDHEQQHINHARAWYDANKPVYWALNRQTFQSQVAAEQAIQTVQTQIDQSWQAFQTGERNHTNPGWGEYHGAPPEHSALWNAAPFGFFGN